ncbi:multidrug effflux MFS transporter [Pseudoxanthomonas taiwanensis]|jgi:drug resistance transporter, Bcr/CflA subfamily|uniref:Bcr/CflA family efflux transporter n=1 Tax=Pseudoxanthomonas taiwanensis TaxID=176598 RepID=A0A921NV73_9GAMM|nr:multidrug effflux MFS transporter [Pseudoxanthomonas taiwanensis]KAF1690400.1 Bcr/CflA family drug resistance efflux transporter [Pseudoxanthomonas taiwanensis]MBO2466736.1 Bcr/CflA family drug resistance efflux transporter [Xanthomonadaceae bacterium]
MNKQSTRRLALLLGGLAMFGPFSIDTIFPAFPQMAAQLGADKVAMQQTISVYLAAYALMSVVHGPLSDAIGRRRVILGGLVVFTLASVGCALSRDLATLLCFRALQGLSAGVGLIVGRAVIRDVLQGDDAQRLMSQVSMIFGIAPAIAPVIGGWMLGAGRWPLIFWFLAAFGALLIASVGRWLPETHPPQARLPLRPRHLARDYLAIAANPRFLRLAAAGALTFGGLFLYIASAPAFVMELLRLGERDFAWLFIPTIGGMTLGAFVSGRVAGRWPAARQVGAGFACCGLAAAANLAYNALAAGIAVPWAVLPMSLFSFGVALVFPVLTLAILDMYPRQRGSASSLQAFLQLVLNALIAGLLSPLLSHHGLHLALGMAAFGLAGWLFWRWESHVTRRLPPTPATPMIEPGEQL